MEDTLFSANIKRPLADRLRPQTLEEVVGQDHLVGADAPLGRMLKSGKISSFILWGPPGCGKTTIARLIAEHTNLYFEQISAVFSGVADLKRVFQYAQDRRANQGKGTLLFVDEIHRFNKSQQDGFLPYVEDGTIILVGATTENPSFELNAAAHPDSTDYLYFVASGNGGHNFAKSLKEHNQNVTNWKNNRQKALDEK